MWACAVYVLLLRTHFAQILASPSSFLEELGVAR